MERKRQQAMLIGLDDNRTWSQPLYLPRTAFAIVSALSVPEGPWTTGT